MQRAGIALMVVGVIAIVVGLIGLLSTVLQQMGVAFRFEVVPWYGPLLAGIVLAAIGWVLRRQAPPADSRA